MQSCCQQGGLPGGLRRSSSSARARVTRPCFARCATGQLPIAMRIMPRLRVRNIGLTLWQASGWPAAVRPGGICGWWSVLTGRHRRRRWRRCRSRAGPGCRGAVI